MISKGELSLEKVLEADIEKIIEIESHVENRDYLWVGTYEEHLAEINDKNQLLLKLIGSEEDKILGYLLARIDYGSEIFELRRLAIVDKGRGYGRRTMEIIMDYAFNRLKLNRFWLDVYPENTVGIKLYESLGLHVDGVLRQNYKDERGYLDQIIYSILKDEYRASRKNIIGYDAL